jgi:hypothetical protein
VFLTLLFCILFIKTLPKNFVAFGERKDYNPVT